MSIFNTISFSEFEVNSTKYFLNANKESIVAYVEPKYPLFKFLVKNSIIYYKLSIY